MNAFVTFVTAVLVLTACGMTLLAAIGLLRFDSVFARIHPVTKATTLGVVTVCLAGALQVDSTSDALRLLLVAVFQVVTAPIAAHMVARAAYRTGPGSGPGLPIDELRDAGRAGDEPPTESHHRSPIPPTPDEA